MKANEAAGIFKSNDLAAQPENDSSNNEVDKNSTGYQAGAGGPRSNQSVFGLLRIIDGASADLSDSFARRRQPADAAAASQSDGYAGNGIPSLASRLAGLDTRRGLANDEGEEERRLARRLTARFDEPVRAARQTMMSALTPYMAATGFFVVIAGGSAVYFIADSTSSKSKIAGSALADPRIPQDLKVIAAWSATNSAPRPADEQTAAKKQPIQRTTLNVGREQPRPAPVTGWTTTPVEPDAGISSPKTPVSAQNSQEKLENWAETVETFKQFVGAKAVPQGQKAANLDNERLLEKLEAWQNAKK
jgi:hypothetical protein